MLLRKFYVQENEKAPEPKQKKTRELKTEILPMDIHAPKSTPSPALATPPAATASTRVLQDACVGWMEWTGRYRIACNDFYFLWSMEM
jgi:hypothetical protein